MCGVFGGQMLGESRIFRGFGECGGVGQWGSAGAAALFV
ncbi:hypothetical protein HMPREF1324_1522 [Rothia aeria F0474]|uniref:Uncharacterized protein n=1 Tax=Rothia aeria F0474 TaxID=1125724 RepID=I0UV52_9MICC|nr:hypothetical protein HMPREF1324_1522 [Rothia aeria F0474]